MALTAEQLYKAAQLEPSSFGARIVDPQLSESEQEAVAVSYISTDVLPGAKAEVSVPFRQRTGANNVRAFLEARFTTLDLTTREELISEGEALFDAAVKSYGRSELNKIVASNAAEYDKDSDQDRIQGNQRLAKLLEWAGTCVVEETTAPEQLHSEMVFISPVWGQGKSFGDNFDSY